MVVSPSSDVHISPTNDMSSATAIESSSERSDSFPANSADTPSCGSSVSGVATPTPPPIPAPCARTPRPKRTRPQSHRPFRLQTLFLLADKTCTFLALLPVCPTTALRLRFWWVQRERRMERLHCGHGLHNGLCSPSPSDSSVPHRPVTLGRGSASVNAHLIASSGGVCAAE
nr:hypothetical protein Iba_chr09dCG13210 [Ipomoea batatas]